MDTNLTQNSSPFLTSSPSRLVQARNARENFRPDIQGLRAIAVVAVLIFHYSPKNLQGGFVGVDIFFVISGYLISAHILKEIDHGEFSLLEFYARRIRRLYPALILIFLATIIAGWTLVFPINFMDLGRQIISATVFAANINFFLNSGYFANQTAAVPLLHLWSLGVEEQFYIFFPFICLLGASSKTRTAVLFYAMAAISLAVDLLTVKHHSNFCFYMPITRFWEFFFGIFLAFYEPSAVRNWRARPSFGPVSEGLSLVGLALIAFSVLRIKETFLFPGYWAILPCLGAALLILGGSATAVNRWVLSNRVAVFLGTISYPLYLWHWPILVYIRVLTFNNGPLPLKLRIIGSLSAVILASLTYYYVERPLAGFARGKRKNIAVWSYVAAFAVVGIFGISTIAMHGYPSRFNPEAVSFDHDYEKDAQIALQYGTCFMEETQPPSDFDQSCNNINHVADPQLTALIWGDSHAADLYTGFAQVLTPENVRLGLYSSSFCAPLLKRELAYRPFCLQTNDFIMDKVRVLKPDIVILSGEWPNTEDSYAKLGQTIKSIQAAGVKQVVVIGQAPLLRRGAVEILETELQRHPKTVIGDNLPASFLKSGAMDEAGMRQATVAAGARYISLISFLCHSDGCLVRTGSGWKNIVVYDDAHFTEHGSRYVADHVANAAIAGFAVRPIASN